MNIPLGVMVSNVYGSDLMMISNAMMAKLYTSPFWVPRGGGKFSRRISGLVHILPAEEAKALRYAVTFENIKVVHIFIYFVSREVGNSHNENDYSYVKFYISNPNWQKKIQDGWHRWLSTNPFGPNLAMGPPQTFSRQVEDSKYVGEKNRHSCAGGVIFHSTVSCLIRILYTLNK